MLVITLLPPFSILVRSCIFNPFLRNWLHLFLGHYSCISYEAFILFSPLHVPTLFLWVCSGPFDRNIDWHRSASEWGENPPSFRVLQTCFVFFHLTIKCRACNTCQAHIFDLAERGRGKNIKLALASATHQLSNPGWIMPVFLVSNSCDVEGKFSTSLLF